MRGKIQSLLKKQTQYSYSNPGKLLTSFKCWKFRVFKLSIYTCTYILILVVHTRNINGRVYNHSPRNKRGKDFFKVRSSAKSWIFYPCKMSKYSDGRWFNILSHLNLFQLFQKAFKWICANVLKSIRNNKMYLENSMKARLHVKSINTVWVNINSGSWESVDELSENRLSVMSLLILQRHSLSTLVIIKTIL